MQDTELFCLSSCIAKRRGPWLPWLSLGGLKTLLKSKRRYRLPAKAVHLSLKQLFLDSQSPERKGESMGKPSAHGFSNLDCPRRGSAVQEDLDLASQSKSSLKSSLPSVSSSSTFLCNASRISGLGYHPACCIASHQTEFSLRSRT